VCIKVFMPNLCECVLLVSMKQLYITVEIITVGTVKIVMFLTCLCVCETVFCGF
jgi:hypothetical protein